jgi:glycosyltransferase involved in cell wall biosynthesis
VAARLAIFHPPGQLSLKANPFGKDVANLQLYRALARHGGFERLDVLSFHPGSDEQLAQDLLDGAASPTRLTAGTVLNQQAIAEAGALLRGQPDLHELAWLRRHAVGDRAYSLLGLVHTLAPAAIRQVIAMSLMGPTHPWDAIICTSPSVQQALTRMLGDFGDYLAERTSGGPPTGPALPIVPLGVDGEAFRRAADRPQARAALRARLAIAEEDVLVLWVGRLSYYEKAFPQPMFRAVQAAANASGAKVAFAMAGWFPGEKDRALYEGAAAVHAPDVEVHFLDGNDRGLLDDLWAGSDIFLSLVDNIQETFGITPLEAMAAGLPVVASDWDGYRYTVRDGVDGFLIPTLGGPDSGYGESIVARHALEMDSYQRYVGTLAQYTAVHPGRCAEALTQLIRSPELRRRMGEAGRERVRSAFDWPVVARQYQALLDDLAVIRASAPQVVTRHRSHPVKGDPFRAFAGFATRTMSLDLTLSVPPGVAVEELRRMEAVDLDQAFSGWRCTQAECAQALELVASGRASTVREVLLAFPPPRRRPVEMGLVWMAKHGLLDWLG